MSISLKDSYQLTAYASQPTTDTPHKENAGNKDIYRQDTDDLITSQSDLKKIKPFISLKRFTARHTAETRQPTLTPASGQAIITYVVSGEAMYSDSTGKQGILKKDGWSWVISGAGIWYSIDPLTSDYVGIQLCIALSPALENSSPQTAYLNPDLMPRDNPAQVLIGWHGKNRSEFAIPSLTNYLVVHLNARQHWSYELPLNHRFAWVGVVSGQVETNAGDMRPNHFTVVNRPIEKIEFHALADSIIVIGSSLDFDHDLIFENGSVHTSLEALQQGFAGISAAGKTLPI